MTGTQVESRPQQKHIDISGTLLDGSPQVDVLSFLPHTWRLFASVAVSQNRSCVMVSATRNVFAWHREGNRPRN